MRTWPLLAAMLVLALPSASAAGSSVELTGPANLAAEGPATATLDLVLTLDRVVCPGGAEVPVDIRITETRGLKSASLTWERVTFRLAGHEAAAGPWSASSQVGVRVWGRDPAGHVEVTAGYTLPPNCVASGGAASGESRHLIHVQGPAPEPEAPVQRLPPAPATKSETVLPAAAPEESKLRPIELDAPGLPGPVLGAIAGMFLGGAVVFAKRIRGMP